MAGKRAPATVAIGDCWTLRARSLLESIAHGPGSGGVLTDPRATSLAAQRQYVLERRDSAGHLAVRLWEVGPNGQLASEQVLPLEMDTNHGGLAIYFHCPLCSVRGARLYLPPRATLFRCQACHGVAGPARAKRKGGAQGLLARIERQRERLERQVARMDAQEGQDRS